MRRPLDWGVGERGVSAWGEGRPAMVVGVSQSDAGSCGDRRSSGWVRAGCLLLFRGPMAPDGDGVCLSIHCDCGCVITLSSSLHRIGDVIRPQWWKMLCSPEPGYRNDLHVRRAEPPSDDRACSVTYLLTCRVGDDRGASAKSLFKRTAGRSRGRCGFLDKTPRRCVLGPGRRDVGAWGPGTMGMAMITHVDKEEGISR